MKKIVLFCGILLLGASFSLARSGANVGGDISRMTDTVTVMSFNIRFNNPKDSFDTSWDSRREPCRRMIETVSPDVIGVQEVRNVMWQQVLDMLPEYGHYRVEPNDTISDSKTGGMLMLYRRDKFDLLKSGSFWLSGTPEKPSRPWNSTDRHYRTTVWVQLKDKQTGNTFYVASTHLPYKPEAVDTEVRGKCAELIIDKMRSVAGDDAPVFVTGDMNASLDVENPRRPGLIQFYKWFASARETAEVTDAALSFNGFGRVAPDAKGYNLDHIFYRNAWPLTFETINHPGYGVRWISDHYPVIGKFIY